MATWLSLYLVPGIKVCIYCCPAVCASTAAPVHDWQGVRAVYLVQHKQQTSTYVRRARVEYNTNTWNVHYVEQY